MTQHTELATEREVRRRGCRSNYATSWQVSDPESMRRPHRWKTSKTASRPLILVPVLVRMHKKRLVACAALGFDVPRRRAIIKSRLVAMSFDLSFNRA